MSQRVRLYIFYLAFGLLPLGLLLLPSLAQRLEADSSVFDFLSLAPYVAFAVLALLGWKLNQTRIFFTAALFLALYGLWRHPQSLQHYGLSLPAYLHLLSIGLPLALVLAFLGRECALFSSRMVLRAGAGLLPLLLLAGTSAWSPESFQQITDWNPGLPPHLLERLKIPLFSLGSLLALAATALFWKDQKIKLFLSVLFACFLPLFICLRAGLDAALAPGTSALLLIMSFGVVAAMLLHAIFLMYWSKVYVDELTEVPNRRALDERLQNLSGHYSLAMMDIDHFKKFNDQYGHDEGDNVLRLVAAHLRQELGPDAYRYGGEEFCAVFEGVEARQAFVILDNMRAKLAQREFHIRSHPTRRKTEKKGRKEDGPPALVKITLSVGVANSQEKLSPEKILKKADQALYQAKEGGRNCVMIAKDK